MWVKRRGIAADFETFLVIAHSVWGRRNRRIFEASTEDLKTVIDQALGNFKLYSECLATPTRDLSNVGCWKPLEQGFLKLNTDGAIFANLQDAGIDAILRNWEVDVLMATSFKERSI